jgi:nitroreductase
MEAGHVGQNVSLEAVSLGLATVMVGAFQDDRLVKVLHLEKHVEPLYIIPVGKPA